MTNSRTSTAITPSNFNVTSALSQCSPLPHSIDAKPLQVHEIIFNSLNKSIQNSSINHDKISNHFNESRRPDNVDSKKNSSVQEGLSEKEIEKLQQRYFRLNFPLDSLFERLQRSIIGQEDAVKGILFAIYNNQYLNLLEDLSVLSIPVKRIQVLAVGPSGVGKTKTISKIAELFNVPYVKFNATQLTASGYVGSDVNMILSNLVEAAGGDVEAAQRGIIFIDEVDKKVSSDANNTSGKDISGTAIQEELLKILEPSIVYLGSNQIPFDTHSLTVVAGGCFDGLNEIREKRLKGPKTMGFAPSKTSDEDKDEDEEEDYYLTSQKATCYLPEDFIKLGFLGEFIGRFSKIEEFHKLDYEQNLDIIFAEDSILQQYLQIFRSRDVTLYIDPIHYTRIAKEISNSPTGARHLEMKIINLLQPLLYQVLQHFTPGICEIDAEGKYYWMFDDGTCNF